LALDEGFKKTNMCTGLVTVQEFAVGGPGRGGVFESMPQDDLQQPASHVAVLAEHAVGRDIAQSIGRPDAAKPKLAGRGELIEHPPRGWASSAGLM